MPECWQDQGLVWAKVPEDPYLIHTFLPRSWSATAEVSPTPVLSNPARLTLSRRSRDKAILLCPV